MDKQYEAFIEDLDNIIVKYLKILPKRDMIYQLAITFTSLVKTDDFEKTIEEQQESRLEAMDLVASCMYGDIDREDCEIYH